MKYKRLALESLLSGKDMYKITNWKSINEIQEIEHKLNQTKNLSYLFCEVGSTDLQSIHDLEKFGYHFSEFRILTSLNLQEFEISPRAFFPYYPEVISDQKHFKNATEMLSKMNADDRFSKDPLIGAEFSLNRTLKNLKKSFSNWPNEFLVGVFNQQTDELIAFRSGGFISPNEAHLYQYGISPFKDHDHTSEILETLTLSFLKQRNIEIVHAVSTGFNTDELNRLIKKHNFKITGSKILMRKFISNT